MKDKLAREAIEEVAKSLGVEVFFWDASITVFGPTTDWKKLFADAEKESRIYQTIHSLADALGLEWQETPATAGFVKKQKK